jgi:hypothetical protein
MWRKIFDAASVNLPKENFIRPIYAYKTDPNTKPALKGVWQGGQTYTIDTISGKLATSLTPPETRKEMPIGNVHSILHWLDKEDPSGPAPTKPENDAQYLYWETPVQLWAIGKGLVSNSSTTIPTLTDDIHTAANQLAVLITSPITAATFNSKDRIVVTFNVTQYKYPPMIAELYQNGEFVASANVNGTIGTLTFVPSANHPISGDVEIKVLVKDQVYNRGEATIHLNITE